MQNHNDNPHLALQIYRAVDKQIPGFGAVGLCFLVGGLIFTFKGLGLPFEASFWQRYGSELAQPNLLRWAGTGYLLNSIGAAVVSAIFKKQPEKREVSQLIFTVLGLVSAGIQVGGAVQHHDNGQIFSGGLGSIGNLAGLVGSKTIGGLFKRNAKDLVNHSKLCGNIMTASFGVSILGLAKSAWENHDIGMGVIATLWGLGTFLGWYEMRSGKQSNLENISQVAPV